MSLSVNAMQTFRAMVGDEAGTVLSQLRGIAADAAGNPTFHLQVSGLIDTLTSIRMSVDYALPAAAITLDSAKAARKVLTEQWRDAAEWAGVATPLGRVRTDFKSQHKFGGLVTMALIAKSAGAPFFTMLTMEDGTNVEHDADQTIAMGVAVGTHVAACHAVMVALNAAIDAVVIEEGQTVADAIASIEAITWPATDAA